MYKNNSGIALILAVGIISALAVLALGLSLINKVELKAAENFRQLARAQFIAQAGLAQAISELKYGAEGAQHNPYDAATERVYYRGNAAWENVSVAIDSDAATHPSCDTNNGTIGDGISGMFAGGTYRIKIIDCASRINVNTPLAAGDVDAENDLSNMLRQLGLSLSQSQNLINFRRSLAEGKFYSREEIKLVSGIGSLSGFEDFITLYGNADTGSGHSQRVFVNVNTAHKTVLQAVIYPMISPASASAIVDQIDLRRRTNPFDGKNPDVNVNNFAGARGEFNAFLRYLRAIGIITSDAQLTAIVEQSDPNRNITNSTHLSFDAGGCYEIEVVGAYQGARKHLTQVVKVYEKIYETSKLEFADCNPLTSRVTWKDSCPVNYGCLETLETDVHGLKNAALIPNALKIGFWDDFEEDYDQAGTQKADWVANLERFEINKNGSGLLQTWPMGAIVEGGEYYPNVELDPAKWQFTEFSLRASLMDETNFSKSAFRGNLPFPAVQIHDAWKDTAPPPTIANCPDLAAGKVTEDTLVKISDHCYQTFLNVASLRFGKGAVYCNVPQTTDFKTGLIALYGVWVDYAGEGYIFFAPDPKILDYAIINKPNLMVYCNDGEWPGHEATGGTKYFPLVNYKPHRAFAMRVSGGIDKPNKGLVNVDLYNANGLESVTVTEPLMDYSRSIGAASIDNLFDMDNVRVIPRQGVYTSKRFTPSAAPLEWGTISLGVSLPDGAAEATEKAFVTTNFSAQENLAVVPGPDALPPASALTPAGGNISLSTAASLAYRVYLYSDYMVSTFNTVFKKIPVVEDVTITYLPRTEILYQNMR